MVLTEEQKKIIEKEGDYEWDGNIEKQIQERIDYWIGCYEFIGDNDLILKNAKLQFITSDIKNDLWRDILTSIFDIHNEHIIKKLSEVHNGKI